MRPNMSRTFFPFHLFVILILVAVRTTSAAVDARYRNCSVRFDCANIKNISYPFWGRNRPEYCGHPAFELDCAGEAPVITILSASFRILAINLVSRYLTLARADYWDTICPRMLSDTMIDSSIFRLGSDSQNLTLYYGCIPVATASLPAALVSAIAANGFNCSSAPAVAEYLARCYLNVSEWDAVNELCSNCEASGGSCGRDSGQFAWICSGAVFPAACRTGKKTNRGLVIVFAVGSAAAVSVGLLSATYFAVGRRKRLKIAEFKTKEDGDGGSVLESGGTYMGVRVFKYEELEEATDHFDPSKALGDGGYGIVYYGKLRDGRAVAVKHLYKRHFKRVEQFMNEVKILTRLRHPNLVTLYGCTSRSSRELLLVYEYIPNGTLADHLHGSRSSSGSVPWPLRLTLAVETADALAYLHSSDIIHRDVKTTNILLDCNFHVKVADFGLSRLFPNDVTHVSTAPQGTPGYVDPVYYKCYRLTDRSDVYSFGVVLVELVSSKQAADMSSHHHDVNLASMAVSKMQDGKLHELVDPCLGFEADDELRRAVRAVAGLACRCLHPDREMRPSMDEVVEGLLRIESGNNEGKINNITDDEEN